MNSHFINEIRWDFCQNVFNSDNFIQKLGNWVSRKNDFVKKGYIIKVGHLSSVIGKQHGNKRMGFSSTPFNIDMFM